MSNNRSKLEHIIQRVFSAVSVSSMWLLRIIVDQPPIQFFLQRLYAFIEVLAKSNAENPSKTVLLKRSLKPFVFGG